MNKFGNTHSLCELNHSHRSKLESSVCQILQLRERAKEIKILQVEAHIYLTDARISYIADFKCHDYRDGLDFYVEAKGYANDRWPTIKKLYKQYGPARLEIWTGNYKNPKLTEVIKPPITNANGNRAASNVKKIPEAVGA